MIVLYTILMVLCYTIHSKNSRLVGGFNNTNIPNMMETMPYSYLITPRSQSPIVLCKFEGPIIVLFGLGRKKGRGINMSVNISIDHDLHQHSFLSSCSSDPNMTPQGLLDNAVQNGYHTICITDHVWDSRVSGASNWYKPQDIEHIKKALPLPSAEGVRFCFGCETEYCGGDKLGLSRESLDLFDFIVIPVNHFHMIDFVRPSSFNTPELVADLMMTRLEELQQLQLPWDRVGIAHFTCSLIFSEGRYEDVFEHMPADRLLKIFHNFAEKGTGIELNAASFKPGWEKNFDVLLYPYRMAKKAGCKFYFASDAHAIGDLQIEGRLRPVVEALNLVEGDIYKIPS